MCEVSIPENLQPSAATNGNAATDGAAKGAKVETVATAAAATLAKAAAPSAQQSNNELICLDEADVAGVGNKLDGFSLDDINDDDFNPRAASEDSDEEEEATRSPPLQSAPPQALSPALPPPALPPRVAANNSSNLTATPAFTKQAADNIFSSNPFSGGSDGSGGVDPFGMSAFQSPASKGAQSPFAPPTAAAAVGQSLFDDLDPLRK